MSASVQKKSRVWGTIGAMADNRNRIDRAVEITPPDPSAHNQIQMTQETCHQNDE
jgi:hypothetical protein